MSKPRDFQRQAVYDSETMQFGMPGEYEPDFESIHSVSVYVREVMESDWFIARFGRRPYAVTDGRRRRRACCREDKKTMAFPRAHRHRWVICHETAHLVTDRSHASHGPEFAANYIFILERAVGLGDAHNLLLRFLDNGVKVGGMAKAAT